ncbi:hypothetical protein FDECE_17803 [Fusarium decemcellulare]|nr:hypothetical protein FDECE_17803 [Fusarium decemcellulare]
MRPQSFQNTQDNTTDQRSRAQASAAKDHSNQPSGALLKLDSSMSMTGAAPDKFTCFSNLCSIREPVNGSNCISCAQLMHHYTAIAYRTLLTPCLHACATLQLAVPQEAFINPSLLHQILAFSALHLAYIHPNKRQQYLIQASQHQTAAISGTRELLAKPLTSNSCHALYASSVFVIISGFAIFPACEKTNAAFEPIGGIVDVFVLIGGMSVILESSDAQLRQGPLRGLFRDCVCPLPQVKDQVQEIATKAAALIPLFETSQLHREEKQTLTEATALLVDTIEAGSVLLAGKAVTRVSYIDTAS